MESSPITPRSPQFLDRSLRKPRFLELDCEEFGHISPNLLSLVDGSPNTHVLQQDLKDDEDEYGSPKYRQKTYHENSSVGFYSHAFGVSQHREFAVLQEYHNFQDGAASVEDAAMTAIQCGNLPDQCLGYSDMDFSEQSSSPSLPGCGGGHSLGPFNGGSSPFSSPISARKNRASKRKAKAETREIGEDEKPHLPLIISSNDKPFSCAMRGCGKRFKRQEHLKRHERTHTKERPYGCEALKCGRWFSRSDNLRAHKRTHLKQGGRTPYVPDLQIL